MDNQGLAKLTDVRAEHAVCGAIMCDPDLMLKLVGTLAPADFTNDRSRWVYEAALSLYEGQQPIDWVTMCGALERESRLEEVGGAAFLTRLTLDTPTALHAERYAETLVRLSTFRKLVQFAQKTASLAYNANGQSAAQVVEQVRGMIDGLAPMMSDEHTLLWKDSIARFLDVQQMRLEAVSAPAPDQRARALPFPWENTLGRFRLKLRPGTLALIVAGSGVGKTSLMACCAEKWAQTGYRVAFFHTEISHQDMLDRRTSRLSGLPKSRVEEPQEIDLPLLIDVKARMDAYPGGITYEHCPGWSARQVAARARELHAQGLCDVLIVDYLQKLRLYMPRGYNKNDALADAAEVVKNCCEQLGIPGMIASQVNKKAEEAGRVTAHHIRGTGEADEKANITMILTRPILVAPMNDGAYQPGERSPIMDVWVGKNTFGPTGDAKLFFKQDQFLVTELKQEEEVLW
jgi:replicative DNA helicase